MAVGRFSRGWSALREKARRGIRKLPGAICDLAGFAGAGLISYGAWLIYAPAGFLVGGVLLIAMAMLFGRRFDASAQ